MAEEEFWSKLRDDMLQTRARRAQLQLGKVASIGAVAGAASILAEADRPLFAYVIPFLAMGFDFLILGESFTLRRMSRFVYEYRGTAATEQRWEAFVRLNPLRFSTVGNLGFSLICIIGSVLILLLTATSVSSWFEEYLNLFWLALVGSLFVVTMFVETRFQKTWKLLPKE